MVTPLRIAVQTDWKREASECSLGGFERRESCKLPGYAVEILDFVTKYIKMPYIIVPVSKGVGAGQLIDRKNMIWDGVLGGIQNGRYDTAASPYMLNSDRYATFDFATPFTSTQLMFVIGPSPPDFFAGSVRLFTVFEPTLTTLIIGTLLALICGVFINQAFVTERESLQIRENAPEIVKDDHCMLGEKLRQHKESTQRSATGRTLLLLLNFTLLFFTGLYESCLLTFLLVPTSDVHLTEAQILDLVYEKKLTFVISEDEYYNYGHWQMIRFSKERKFQKFQATLKENPPRFFDGNISQVVKIFRENPSNYVYVGRGHDATIFAKEGCNLQQIRMEDPEVYPAGFVFRKNSTEIINKFNKAIYSNFAFTQSIIRYYRNLDRNTCIQDKSASTNIQPLSLLALFGSFTLLFIGFISSFCYLLFENFCDDARRERLKSYLARFQQRLREPWTASKV